MSIPGLDVLNRVLNAVDKEEAERNARDLVKKIEAGDQTTRALAKRWAQAYLDGTTKDAEGNPSGPVRQAFIDSSYSKIFKDVKDYFNQLRKIISDLANKNTPSTPSVTPDMLSSLISQNRTTTSTSSGSTSVTQAGTSTNTAMKNYYNSTSAIQRQYYWCGSRNAFIAVEEACDGIPSEYQLQELESRFDRIQKSKELLRRIEDAKNTPIVNKAITSQIAGKTAILPPKQTQYQQMQQMQQIQYNAPQSSSFSSFSFE
jgi:hypothetical protein